MTAEQRQKRAERNRRYYQRRRFTDQTGEVGFECLNREASELRRYPTPSLVLKPHEIKTLGIKTSDDSSIKTLNFTASAGKKTSSEIERIFLKSEQVISELPSSKTFKTPREIKMSATELKQRPESEVESPDVKTPGQNQSWRLKELRRPHFAVPLLSLLLAATITFCLINEAYRYYTQHDPAMAFLKALIGELILLYLSLLAPRQWVHRILVKGLLVMTFGYLVWIISMGLALRTSGDVNKLTQVKNMISDVKEQIDDKRSELSELTKSGWISRARKIDEQLTLDQQRLFDLRSRLADIGSDQRELILGNLVSLVLFRVILMFTNIVLMSNLRCIFIPFWAKIGTS